MEEISWDLHENSYNMGTITHMDYFERIEQTLISLIKTCEYVIIKKQAVRIESHKQSLFIVWQYSRK